MPEHMLMCAWQQFLKNSVTSFVKISNDCYYLPRNIVQVQIVVSSIFVFLDWNLEIFKIEATNSSLYENKHCN